MKKTSIVIIIGLIMMSMVGAAPRPIPGGDKDTWGIILNEHLAVTLDDEGYIKQNSVNSSMLDLSEIVVSKFDNDAGYLITEIDQVFIDWQTANPNVDLDSTDDLTLVNLATEVVTGEVKSDTVSGTVHLQQNADSSGRVRFFKETTGTPMITMYGYNPVTLQRPWMYLGMFDYTGVDGYMRTVLGASGGYDDVAAKLELQSPYQVRITGVDSELNIGTVRIAASKEITIHPETVAEEDSAKYLIIDTVGGVTEDGTDVELSTNLGDLVLNPAGNVLVSGAYDGICTNPISLTIVGGIIIDCISSS